MLIWIKTNMGNFTIQNMNEEDTIKTLKLEVLKKMIHKIPRIKNISVNRLRLRNNSGITLVNNNTLEKSNVKDNTTLYLDINMGAFGEVRKPEIDGEYFDINEFIYNTVNSDDIVFVSWGNYIINPIIMREYRSSKYSDWHNVFRQQLPIPLLEHAVNVNKDINMFSIDKGFKSISQYDIRVILESLINQRRGVDKIRINGIDRYSLNTCILLDELGINCVYTDSITNLYFIPELYGYCKASGDENNIQLCLEDLSIKLDDIGVEYFIYGKPLDIATLIHNNNNINYALKQWFRIEHDGGMKGGGVNPGRVITGENLNEHVGRVIRLIDTQGFSDRIQYQIKDLSDSKYIQDFSGFEEGFKFGILLEPSKFYDRHFADDLEPFESLARVRYKNGRVYYFAIPKTFQDIKDHGVFPYYLELANVGLPPYDINPELSNSGTFYSQWEPDYNHIFSAYQIRKKLTQKKKLRDSKQRLALSEVPFDNEAVQKISEYLSNIERDPELHSKMIRENR
jgi:hypothetical protein